MYSYRLGCRIKGDLKILCLIFFINFMPNLFYKLIFYWIFYRKMLVRTNGRSGKGQFDMEVE